MASRRRGGSRKRGAEEIGGAGGCSSSTEDPWSTLFTWRIENFSKQRSELVRSDCFEAGICTWRLRAYPGGDQGGQGSHLSALLEVQDGMWNPKVEIKLTLVNQADASKSITDVHSGARKSTTLGWGVAKFLELTALRNAAAGWLVNDALVLTVDVTVEREDRWCAMRRDPEAAVRGGSASREPAAADGLALLPRCPGGRERQRFDPGGRQPRRVDLHPERPLPAARCHWPHVGERLRAAARGTQVQLHQAAQAAGGVRQGEEQGAVFRPRRQRGVLHHGVGSLWREACSWTSCASCASADWGA